MTQQLFPSTMICTNTRNSIGVLVKKSMLVFILTEMLMVYSTEHLLNKKLDTTQALFLNTMIRLITREATSVLRKMLKKKNYFKPNLKNKAQFNFY